MNQFSYHGRLFLIFCTLFFGIPVYVYADEEKNSASSLELQAVEFVEHYPNQWRGIADGGRLYWNPWGASDPGVFVGYETMQVIPAELTWKDTAAKELYNRLLFSGGYREPISPVALSIPGIGGIDPSVSGVTVLNTISDARKVKKLRFSRSYVGIQTPPREIYLTKGFYFLPGLDILLGHQHGHLNFNGVRVDMDSPFLAIEPNFRFRLDLTSSVSVSLLLPVRFIWMSPVAFETYHGKKRYATDAQGGLSLGCLIRF